MLYHDKEIQDGSGPLIPKKSKEEIEVPVKLPEEYYWTELDLS